MARAHYENFPVASLLLPRSKRPLIAAVYAFARAADDFADEGNDPPSLRLEKLDAWQNKLDACFEGKADHPVFIALAETAARTGTPRVLYSDLLRAFRMDVTTSSFATAKELLEYCTFSANPVGRLVLHIFEGATAEASALSDSICTGLQLANFAQDLSVDRPRGRLYIPLEDLARFGYTPSTLDRASAGGRLGDLVQVQVDRARAFLTGGAPLIGLAPRTLRFELALTVRGGLGILRAVERLGPQVMGRRPTLSLMRYPAIALKASQDLWRWNSQPPR